MGTCECFNHTDVVPCAGGNTTSLISSCQQIADIKYTSRLTWPRCSYPAQVWLLEHPRVNKPTPLFRDQPPSTPSTTNDCPAGPLGHCPSTKNVPFFPAAVSAASKTLAPPTHPNRKARYTSRQGRAAPPPTVRTPGRMFTPAPVRPVVLLCRPSGDVPEDQLSKTVVAWYGAYQGHSAQREYRGAEA